jgi:CheY-like chemotaxis protein
MSVEITNFLDKFAKNGQNVNDLLLVFMTISNCDSGSIFLKSIGNLHNYIAHLYLGKKDTIIEFHPVKLTDTIIVEPDLIKKNFTSNFIIKDIMKIPVGKEPIGFICLFNSKDKFNIGILENLTPYINIAELVLSKVKVEKDNENIYSDNNHFSKELFIANLSHEIRTPLNGIIGYNQLLMKTDLNKIQQSYLMSMNQCSLQLLSIINDIIDFSKLASGNMNIHNECFDIKDITNIVKDILGKNADEKNQKLLYFIDTDIPEYIVCDKQKLIQIIINLVSNAIKFSKQNGSIHISFKQDKENFISVSVKDNGIGISEEEQQKIFNAFIQIQSSTSKTGSGLGLAIAKRLVELLYGKINVKSKLGRGSTFSFNFRYDIDNENLSTTIKNKEILQGKFILVVDDNADNRVLITEILEEWQMYPIVCASALEALRLILNDKYDFSVALIDICMPKTDGIELARQIKEERPCLLLIALSSIDSFVQTSIFEKKLDKPINKIQLFDAIHTTLKNKLEPSTFIGDKFIEVKSQYSNKSSTYNRNVKILIAEDNIVNQQVLKEMLESIGYKNITIANDGLETIDMIEKSNNNHTSYDILLLDLRMPNLDGFGVMNILNRKKYITPQIVVISALVQKEEKIKCKELGIKYFIDKPVQLKDLTHVILNITKNT